MTTDTTIIEDAAPSADQDIIVDQAAIARVIELRADKNDPFPENGNLRIAVVGGGCSGFKYQLEADENVAEDDHVFGGAIVIDEVSLHYMRGTKVGFESSMLGASFTLDNPQAKSSCGCATSFSVDPDQMD